MDIIWLPLADLGTPTARALNQVDEKVDVPTGSNNLRDGRAGQQLPAPRGSEVDEIYKALLKSAETEFRENKRPRCSPIDLQSGMCQGAHSEGLSVAGPISVWGR
jgi:hypothetical protein